MHLLAAQSGQVQDGQEAVDLGQTPAPLIIISAADSDLALLAAGYAALADPKPELRLANALALRHPLSVDLHLEALAAGARLVVLRLLGGLSYWRYLIEQWQLAAQRHGFALAVLPAEGREDPELQAASTLDPGLTARLSAYLDAGGTANATAFLQSCLELVDAPGSASHVLPALPEPLPRAGLFGVDRLEDWRAQAGERPVVPILFYRAYQQAGDTAVIEALVAALEQVGLAPLPLYIQSLKDPASARFLASIFAELPPELIITTTGFAKASGEAQSGHLFAKSDAVVLQAPIASSPRDVWQASSQGLTARDFAMHAALPELDGRLLTRAIGFRDRDSYDAATQCHLVRAQPEPDRIAFVAELAQRWVNLRRTALPQRRIALLFANYPNRDGRLANGVGLDTPASAIRLFEHLRQLGYDLADAPRDAASLMQRLSAGPTNALHKARQGSERLSLADYQLWLAAQPESVQRQVKERWGAPDQDPFVRDKAFVLPLHRYGQLLVGIQPARGYQIDPDASYHDPDLVPPHGYLATYAYIRARSDVVIQLGKHGNLEWLPGKALALSKACYPEVALGAMPQLYPFIVNDPGEGTQAKRRSAAVIVDHLMPPLSRAESYGPYAELERLMDEYAAAAGDRRRLRLLKQQILGSVKQLGLDADLDTSSEGETLAALDGYLCELKEMQIRDGLHQLGCAPSGELLRDTLVALARVPRGKGQGGDASLLRALADDLGLDFDPLDAALGAPWQGQRPEILSGDAPWRTLGDTLERLEALAARLVEGRTTAPDHWHATRAVLDEIETRFRPAIAQSAQNELQAIAAGLAGRFVPPGPSGAPSRGRPDVLPTGRNFFGIDNRSLPTPAAWQLGWQSAAQLLERYRQDEGRWPRALALSAWGTANMRSGGDDIAQALALLGARPTWDAASGRVTGFEILPLSLLGRPRIDVTLRVSGFFRDAFPGQMDLIDSAVQAIAALDEPQEENPLAGRAAQDCAAWQARGLSESEAWRRATLRVFGSKPGAYGAGLQALIDEGGWQDRDDLATAYLHWSGYAYGGGAAGVRQADAFAARLAATDAVIHNQDNREHDLLDSDDYYQFAGGLTAAVASLAKREPRVYHGDHSRPERPRIRSLQEEIARVVRARAANPKWIAGVMRHGYKGAFEIAATLDYLFAFAATTRAVPSGHFDLLHAAYLEDSRVRDWMAEVNPAALAEMQARFEEARERGLWQPKRNDLGQNFT